MDSFLTRNSFTFFLLTILHPKKVVDGHISTLDELDMYYNDEMSFSIQRYIHLEDL